MLSNKEIVERIRHLGKKVGLTSDFAICRQCQFENRAVLGKIDTLKTAPRLDTLEKFANGLGVAIVSTPNGVMTDHKARLMNVGGEVLCKVI